MQLLLLSIEGLHTTGIEEAVHCCQLIFAFNGSFITLHSKHGLALFNPLDLVQFSQAITTSFGPCPLATGTWHIGRYHFASVSPGEHAQSTRHVAMAPCELLTTMVRKF